MRKALTLGIAWLVSAPVIAGGCGPSMVNPVTDIAWSCIFPMRIGGTLTTNANAPDDPDPLTNPICTCMNGPIPRIGITASFWEPARVIDTVSDPYCFQTIGSQMSNPTPGKLGGTYKNHDTHNPTSMTFAQMHYYMFPAWAVMDMFVDLPCIERKEFDIAAMTEILPTWNNDIMALLLNPEAVLFANPATQLACLADSAMAIKGMPRDELFWCMGSWGSMYPLAGTTNGQDYVEANAALATRGLFMLARTGVLEDRAKDYCGAVNTPILYKSHFRLQLMKPVSDFTCHNIGLPGILWTGGKNPPKGGDNFSWMVFRKTNCCVFYK